MTYEQSLAVFSPNGRLIQIEYAQKASDQGSLVTFSIEQDCIHLYIERKNIDPLLDANSKFYVVDHNIYLSYSGLTPDADVLVSEARLVCRNYKLRCGLDCDVGKVAGYMGDFMQRHTIEGRRRPFGARILLLGFANGPRAYVVEPDGNCVEYVAGAIGAKSEEAVKILENEKDNRAYKAISSFVKGEKGLIQSFKITEKGVESLNHCLYD
ncbi:Proteasome subunit alpha type-7 [Dictyocoela roeselum]|nr:Proteasome subunit alpha type-7 [Dictyocoela roeselum]